MKLLLPLLALPSLVYASSVVPRSLQERASKADRIVLAQVLETRTVLRAGDPRRMTTVTRVAVGQDYRGTGSKELEVIQLGGKSGHWEARVPGDAQFEPGETAILLLRCRDEAKSRCTLLGLGEGKLKVRGATVTFRGDERPLQTVVSEIRSAKGSRR